MGSVAPLETKATAHRLTVCEEFCWLEDGGGGQYLSFRNLLNNIYFILELCDGSIVRTVKRLMSKKQLDISIKEIYIFRLSLCLSA